MGHRTDPNLGEGTEQIESHHTEISRKPSYYNQPYVCFLSLDQLVLHFLCAWEWSQ